MLNHSSNLCHESHDKAGSPGRDIFAGSSVSRRQRSYRYAPHASAVRSRTRFDLNLLPVLDALLEEASVTRAARRLGKSQPVISVALQRLRACLDDPILIQAGRLWVLSPRARALVQPVRESMKALHLLLNR